MTRSNDEIVLRFSRDQAAVLAALLEGMAAGSTMPSEVTDFLDVSKSTFRQMAKQGFGRRARVEAVLDLARAEILGATPDDEL